jgi:hypothetical protein
LYPLTDLSIAEGWSLARPRGRAAMASAKERHHIIPRIRCQKLGIAPNFTGNIKKVSVSKHRAWHTLFGTALPEEAIEIIKKEWSLPEEGERALKQLLGNVSLLRRKP